MTTEQHATAPTTPTDDDMLTVHLRVDVTVKVSRSAWVREWGLGNANGPAVQQDVRNYVMANVVEGWTSTVVEQLGGTFTPTVVQRPPTLLVVEGHDLAEMLRGLNSRKHLHTFRLDPRPDGFAYKVNEGGWSPTVGARMTAE